MTKASPKTTPSPTKTGKVGRFFGYLLLLVLFIGGCFGGYAGYYSLTGKALPGTMVGNIKLTGLNKKQIQSRLTHIEQNTQVSFQMPTGKTETFSLSDLGYHISVSKISQQAIDRNRHLKNYFTALFHRQQLKLEELIDPSQTNLLGKRLSQNIKGAKDPKEPTVKLADKGKEFVVEKGQPGYGVVTKSLLDTAKRAFLNHQNLTVPAQIGPVSPLIPEAEAERIKTEAEKLSQPPVSVTGKVKDENRTFSAEQATRRSWILIPDTSLHAHASVSSTEVSKWLTEEQKMVAVPVVEGKRYRHPDGKIVKVKTEAKDGIKVTNIPELAKAISRSLEADTPFTGEYKTEVDKGTWKDKTIDYGAENLAYPAGPGEKWFDVNLSNHTVTAYEGAKVVKGPVPMVNGAPATPTVTGIYKIDRRYTSKTMRGHNADGTPYVTEGVPYAQYFHGGYALHGAPWRSSFGYAGDEGSHGCINLPVGAAKEFYNWATLGTVVVSHY